MNTNRFLAFLIDFLITATIHLIPFSLLVMLPMFQGEAVKGPDVMLKTLCSSLIAMLYLVFRDIPSGGSIGKRIMKLKIVDSDTKAPVSVGRRFLRNITWLLNWIEIFAYLITQKRIGDRIARTDVISK